MPSSSPPHSSRSAQRAEASSLARLHAQSCTARMPGRQSATSHPRCKAAWANHGAVASASQGDRRQLSCRVASNSEAPEPSVVAPSSTSATSECGHIGCFQGCTDKSQRCLQGPSRTTPSGSVAGWPATARRPCCPSLPRPARPGRPSPSTPSRRRLPCRLRPWCTTAQARTLQPGFSGVLTALQGPARAPHSARRGCLGSMKHCARGRWGVQVALRGLSLTPALRLNLGFSRRAQPGQAARHLLPAPWSRHASCTGL